MVIISTDNIHEDSKYLQRGIFIKPFRLFLKTISIELYIVKKKNRVIAMFVLQEKS